MQLSTIGFTGKSAEVFFRLLRTAGVKSLLDVRLNNTSQLAGFAKKTDLSFFLRELTEARYVEVPELAPESQYLKRYRAKEIEWDEFAAAYCDTLAARSVERTLDTSLFEHGCLLCSEHRPERCHRRLAVDYLNLRWGSKFKVTHLL